MIKSTYSFSLDIHDTTAQNIIAVKTEETGRRFVISLREDGKPYFPTQNCVAFLFATKPNNAQVLDGCTINLRDGTVIYDVNSDLIDGAGIANCELRLYDDNNTLICSPTFLINVYNRALNDNTPSAQNSYNALTEAISQLTTLKNSYPVLSGVKTYSELSTGIYIVPNGTQGQAALRVLLNAGDVSGRSISDSIFIVNKGTQSSALDDGQMMWFQLDRGKNVEVFWDDVRLTDGVYSSTLKSFNFKNGESKSNRTTSVNSSSDDSHYPTAKAVFDAIQDSLPNVQGVYHVSFAPGTTFTIIDLNMGDGFYFVKMSSAGEYLHFKSKDGSTEVVKNLYNGVFFRRGSDFVCSINNGALPCMYFGYYRSDRDEYNFITRMFDSTYQINQPTAGGNVFVDMKTLSNVRATSLTSSATDYKFATAKAAYDCATSKSSAVESKIGMKILSTNCNVWDLDDGAYFVTEATIHFASASTINLANSILIVSAQSETNFYWCYSVANSLSGFNCGNSITADEGETWTSSSNNVLTSGSIATVFDYSSTTTVPSCSAVHSYVTETVDTLSEAGFLVPECTDADNGKVLKVVNGVPTWTT